LRVVTNVVECPFPELRAGMPLEVVFTALSDELTVPQFRPA
jgi:hypothetical protein